MSIMLILIPGRNIRIVSNSTNPMLSEHITIISGYMMSNLYDQSKESPRRRKNLNLHESYKENCQRLLNAIHVNSYIRPHRHKRNKKKELLVALKGHFSLITFDNVGNFNTSYCFGTESFHPNVGIEVPPNAWHTVVARVKNSVLLEVKEGPFSPNIAKEFASWAPEEGTKAAASFLRKCHKFAAAK